MASVSGPKGSKKNRKFGRNKVFCEAYRRSGRREKNKARRIERHLRIYPGDGCAREALNKLFG